MFIWNKGDLNAEQELAIFENDSALIIACPGSGKTRTLTYKIAFELSRLKSKKEFIIAITYTNAAADEIKERIETLGVDVDQLWVGTIHSFCLEWIIRPYHLYLEELKNGFKILNSHDAEVLITELCKPYSQPKITYWDFNYFATDTGYQLTCADPKKKVYLEEVLSLYHKTLAQSGQIDFEQILFYSFKLLIIKPIINSILSKIFSFILIDEYQDTKLIQYRIISSILFAGGGKTKTLIVGDPNQSIYETLGGFPMMKNEMETLFGFPLKEHHLSGNYRSSAKIINYFDFFKTYPNSITPKGKHLNYESVITFNFSILSSEIVDEIVKLILFNINEKGISPNEICIAAPQWAHLASLTRNLMVKLPDYSFDGPGMAPFSRDIDNFWYKFARIILTEPSPELYIRRLRWAREVLHELTFLEAPILGISSKQFLKICNSITNDEIDGLNYLKNMFREIFDELSIDMNTYPLLKEHYESFFNSSYTRIEKLRKEGNDVVGTTNNFKKIFKQREGIKISTIHGVKGTEFDTIIGFGLLNDWVPHFSDINGKTNSKKILYVLGSRARKNIHLISEKGRNVNKYNVTGLKPTEYLTEYVYCYDS